MTKPGFQDDDGLTMVELLVVMVVSGVILALLAGLFGNSLAAQQQATQRNAATAQVNAVTASITESIRSSTAFEVSPDGTRIDVTVLKDDGTSWECRAWQLLAGELRYSAGATARTSAPSTWVSLIPGIVGGLSESAPFSGAGKRLALAFVVTQSDAVVTVNDGAVSRAVQIGGPECF